MRIPFAIGRLTARSAEVVVVRPDPGRPFPAPWALKALVRGTARRRLDHPAA